MNTIDKIPVVPVATVWTAPLLKKGVVGRDTAAFVIPNITDAGVFS